MSSTVLVYSESRINHKYDDKLRNNSSLLQAQCFLSWGHVVSGPMKHQSAVTCLQFNNRFVITSSDDGTVKLWDVKTGVYCIVAIVAHEKFEPETF